MINLFRVPITSRLPTLSIAVLLISACGGGNSGDDNSNSNNVGVDAQVDAAADATVWSYDCPTEQPANHVCVKGQVRDFVTDEPVPVPAGALITMYAARNKDDFPNELEAEVVVQPDGRFIFPSVEQYLVQQYTSDNHTTDFDAYYHLFSLRLDTQLTNYRIADNRFGLDFSDFEVTYYVVSEGTVDAWEENWLYKPGEAPEDWILDADVGFKTLIGLCYGEPPFPPPPTPQVDQCLYVRYGADPAQKTSMQLDSDRLQFTSLGPEDCFGMGVGYVPSELSGAQRIFVSCDYFDMSRPALGQVGPVDVDDSGDLVVIHGPVLENVTYH